MSVPTACDTRRSLRHWYRRPAGGAAVQPAQRRAGADPIRRQPAGSWGCGAARSRPSLGSRTLHARTSPCGTRWRGARLSTNPLEFVAVTDHTTSALNASGFLFQLRVEEEIRANGDGHSWTVAAREHPWTHEKSGRSGFADLVLEAGPFGLVIECKRSRQAHWYFIVPDAQPALCRSAIYWLQDVPREGQRIGWDPLDLTPTTHESTFCVVRGSGENDQPLLERIGALLVDSVEAIARTKCSTSVGRDGSPTMLLASETTRSPTTSGCRSVGGGHLVRVVRKDALSCTPPMVIRPRRTWAL